MAKAVVSIARLVTIRTMTIRRVLLAVRAPTVIKYFNLPKRLAKHARRAGTRRPKACQAWTIATNARLGKRTHTEVPL